jgi:hypothetical protein
MLGSASLALAFMDSATVARAADSNPVGSTANAAGDVAVGAADTAGNVATSAANTAGTVAGKATDTAGDIAVKAADTAGTVAKKTIKFTTDILNSIF